MATFLDDISIYNAKAAVAIKNLSISGRAEEATLLSSLKTTANDTTLTDALRLTALTALINKAGLLDVALGPYFPSAIGFQPTQVYAGIHNALDGLNTGDFWHLTFAEYTKLVNLPTSLTVDFADITGDPTDNVNLDAALLQKEGVITASTANKFFSWDKTFRDIDYTFITNKPTTLAGLGISSGDTLFDAKYVAQASVMTSFVVGTNTPITNTNSLVGALGNLQAQINSISASSGTLNSVGIITPVGFFLNVTNSPITGAGGDFSFNLASQTGGTFFAAPSGGNGTPSFRPIEAADFPVVPGLALGTYGNSSQYPVISVDTKGRITGVTLQNAGGTGTVQSVDVFLPTNEFGKTGGPVTANGNISFAWQNQAQKKVFAGPVSGANAVPGFRLLEKTDIPNIDISQVNDLTAALNNNNNLNTLSFGQIWIGNEAEQPQQREITGVISLDSDGLTTVNDDSISLNALEYINPNTILGRYDSPSGPVQPIALSNDFVISPTGILSLDTPVTPVITSAGQLLTYNNTAAPPAQAALPAPTAGQVLLGYPGRPAPDGYGLIWQTLGGVISSVDHITGAVSLSNNSIDYIKLKNSTGNNILLGRAGGAGPIVELNGTQAATIIDAFNGGAKGLVPAIASPDATKFLAGDGTWITPTGGGSPAGSGTEVQYRLSSTTFGAIPYMAYDSAGGEIRTAGPNFLLVDDVTTVAKSVYFDIGNVTSTGLSWAFPDTTDTFVGELYTQTLENKTLGTGTVISVGTPDAGTIWYSSNALGTLTALTAGGNALKYLRVNSSETGLEWVGSTSGIAIGDTITGATAGSVLFAGTAGVLAQENGDFFWDNTNKYLGIGTAVPECGLHVVTSGSANIKGVMNMHFDSNAANQAKFIGARGRGNKNSPSAIQADDAITSLSGRGYKTSAWSNTVGGFYIYASENWTDSITGTYLTFRGVANGGTAITEWGRISNNATTTTFNIGATSAVALTTAATTASIFNTTATTLNIGGAATAVNLGGGSGCAISLGGGANVAELRFLEGSGSGNNYVGLKSPATLGGNTDYVLPSSDGTAGTVLQTNGSGVLSWVNNGGPLGTQYLKNTTGTTITNPTGNTIIETLIIPAGTFTSNDSFLLLYRVTGTISVSSISFQISINTTNTIGGVQVATHALGAGTTNFSGNLAFNLYGGGSGNTTRYVGNPTTNATQIGSSTTAIDWSVTQYMIMWCGASINRNITNLLIGLTPL